MAATWRLLPCGIDHLRLDIVLTSGQSFRWRQTADKEWTGVFKGKVWTLKQDEFNLYYRVYENTKTCTRPKNVTKNKQANAKTDCIQECNDTLLKQYFQIDVDILKLYKIWSEKDSYFKEISSQFSGIRALQQDPVENLFSFICSSNNNISRITSMVEKLCIMYGDKIADVDNVAYHDFPRVEALASDGVEERLRNEGFGYRARYISQSAKMIKNKGIAWLHGLREVSYDEARQALMELPGVGGKVADCVCLMSMNKTNAIPVDTHVWQITAKYYMPNLSTTKSLTDKLYKQIGDYYRELFGVYAGWAQFVLFSADLKKFQNIQEQDYAEPKKRASTPVKQAKSTKKAKKL